MRRRLLRPLPVGAVLRLQGRTGFPAEPDAGIGWGNMSSEERPEAQDRGLQVRLLRRLPAQPAGRRRRAARRCERGGDRLLSGGLPQDAQGALRHRPGGRLHHHAPRRRAHPAGAAAVPHPGHHRGLRHGGRHSGAAQLEGRQRVRALRLRVARLHQHAEDVHADRRARAGGFRTARLSHQQVPAGRTDLRRRWPGRKPNIPTYSVCLECKRRGERLHRGGAGGALPGAGHAGRLRRAVPQLRSRLLRLLRPDGERQRHSRSATNSHALGRERPGDRARPSAASTPGPGSSAR